MLRFSVRDVLWLTAVTGILALWAGERQWSHPDRERIQRNQSFLYQKIEMQGQSLAKLSAAYNAEVAQPINLEQRIAKGELNGH